jgi:hypothetical protein
LRAGGWQAYWWDTFIRAGQVHTFAIARFWTPSSNWFIVVLNKVNCSAVIKYQLHQTFHRHLLWRFLQECGAASINFNAYTEVT